mgnify:CR=1 FL=1
MVDIGKNIKRLRQERGITQADLASALGVTCQAVSKWESGTSDPSTSNLFSLAKLFGIPVEKLLQGVNSDA